MENNLPSITLHHMQMFVVVADEKGFAKASRKLNMTQSAVSKAIAKIERELGLKLFIRTTRYLELTKPGALLYRDWKMHLSSLQNSYRQALQIQKSAGDILHIGLMNTARPDKYFYPLIKKFENAFPEIKYDVESQYMTDLTDSLETGHFDIVILPDFTRFYIEKRSLSWDYFAKANACLIMSSRHPLAKRKKLKTKDIVDLKFVAVSTFTNEEEYITDLAERFSPYGKKPDIAHIYKTAYDIRYLFRPDDAVLLVDSFFDYPADAHDIVILPVIDQKNGVIFAWNPERALSSVNKFIEIFGS